MFHGDKTLKRFQSLIKYIQRMKLYLLRKFKENIMTEAKVNGFNVDNCFLTT